MKKRIFIVFVVLMLLFTSLAYAGEQCPVCTTYDTDTHYTNHYEYDTCPYTGGCTIVIYCKWEWEYCNLCEHTWGDTHTTLDSYHDDPICPYY
jgi:hypothetical protein